MSDCINLEYRALVQESANLTAGIRAGIRSLCTDFYSEELLVPDLHHLSSNDTIPEDVLVEKVLNALQDRVKVDRSAFSRILNVLHKTMSLEYLAVRLQKRLMTLEEAHGRAIELQAVEARKQQQHRDMLMKHELVIQQHNLFKRSRPCSIGPNEGIAVFRGTVEASHGINTEPADVYRDKSPQTIFHHVQASSLGSGMRILETSQDR